MALELLIWASEKFFGKNERVDLKVDKKTTFNINDELLVKFVENFTDDGILQVVFDSTSATVIRVPSSGIILKISKPTKADFVQMKHEINALRILNGVDYAPKLYDYCFNKSLACIAIEDCGEDCFEQFTGISKNDWRTGVFALASGLNKMHLKGVVHQDIKLENICFDKNKKWKFIDFGLSFVPKNAWKSRNGTIPYIIPHVNGAVRDCNVSSFDVCKVKDYYAFAVVFLILANVFTVEIDDNNVILIIGDSYKAKNCLIKKALLCIAFTQLKKGARKLIWDTSNVTFKYEPCEVQEQNPTPCVKGIMEAWSDFMDIINTKH